MDRLSWHRLVGGTRWNPAHLAGPALMPYSLYPGQMKRAMRETKVHIGNPA